MTKPIKLSKVETRIINNLLTCESNRLLTPQKDREAEINQTNINVVNYLGRTKAKGKSGYFRFLETLRKKVNKLDESFYKR